MKLLAWVGAVFFALLALGALADRFYLAFAIFLIVAIALAPVAAIRDRLQRFGLQGRYFGIALTVVALVGFVVLANSYAETPKGKAAAAKREAERAARQASEKKREQEEAEADRAEQAAKEKAKLAEKSEEKRKGFHCLSGWDGSNRGVVAALKDNLRDPDSFEHAETRLTPVNKQGEHLLIMKYRAANGFGGMNIGHLMATIQNSDCSFKIVSVE